MGLNVLLRLWLFCFGAKSNREAPGQTDLDGSNCRGRLQNAVKLKDQFQGICVAYGGKVKEWNEQPWYFLMYAVSLIYRGTKLPPLYSVLKGDSHRAVKVLKCW